MKRLFFLLTLVLAAQDPQAIFQAALSKMQEAGALAQQGKFATANELIVAAGVEMDRAIELAPDNIEFRARRGVAYSFLSYVPGKKKTATEDLILVSAHPRFGELSEDLRRQVSRQLASLVEQPDRFPFIPEQTSPLIAAASFTVPTAADSLPAWVGATTAALKGYPGLLGAHVVSSVDHPGMFIVFTWWKDKKALNDFFYSGLHQAWMRQRGVTMTKPNAAPTGQMPTQTAIEVFAGLAGGSQINGGFIPESVFAMFKNTK